MMTAKDLLSDKVPVLHPAMPVAEALSRMEESRLCFLPVTDGGIYLGTVCEKSLHDRADMHCRVQHVQLSFPFVREEETIFDALSRMTQLSLDMLPVVASGNRYAGAIDRESLLEKWSAMCGSGHPGAVIGLELYPEDYTLSELARLVEDNNAKIVHLLTCPQEGSRKWQVCLKIDREEAEPLLRSLERFDYKVIYCSRRPEILDETLRKRWEELMFYLEM